MTTALPTRREVLSGFTALAATAAAPYSPSLALEELVSGRVVSAEDGTGIARVMVSNGRDVTVTASDGSWELKSGANGTVFVIKPPGWTYASDAGVPSFSHSVQSGDQGIVFQLKPQIESDSFDVALVADTQAANARELDYVRREIQRTLASGDYAFAISHGDVMGDDLALLAPYKEIVRSTGMVWHHCPGNHDMDLSSPSQAQAFETWRREIGPAHYAFQYASATFIILNNVEFLGAGSEPLDGRLYRGRIGADQLAFVRNVLANVPAGQLIVVSMHIPLVSFENPKAPGDNTADRAELMQILSSRPCAVSFSGHSHTTEHHYLGVADGFMGGEPHHHHVLTAFCGSWWGGPLNTDGIPVSDSRDGSPRGFHVLSVNGSKYQTRFVAAGDCEQKVGRCAASPAQAQSAEHGRTITVDVFDGGPKTKIFGEVPGTPQTFELTRAAIPDPHIVESFAKHRDLLKPWVTPSPSSHIWTAQLPEGLKSCRIRIADEYGRFCAIDVADLMQS